MGRKIKKIIFTDLDGTLLDPVTYSYQKVLSLIKKLKKEKVPIIFCTAKTKAESEYYQKKLRISDPFIVENGGAIFIPKNYFSLPAGGHIFSRYKTSKKYYIIELGTHYQKLRKTLKKIRKETGFKIKGFGDMTAQEVAKDSGLPLALAKLAKKKQYNESFNFYESPEKEKILFKKVKEAGLKLTHGGRYYNIIGKNTDKGRAVKILTNLFKKQFKQIKTIGLGDSLNDLPLLKEVDIPILVKNKEGIWNPKIKFKKLIKIKSVGPQGWKKAIKKYAL